MVTIGPAGPDDIAGLPALQVEAGARFRDAGLHRIADGPPPPATVFAEAVRCGHLLVARDDAGQLVGFVRLSVVDEALHIEQVSVARSHSRLGIGRRLLAAAEEAARRAGFRQLTLTTFRDVAFNGPFYAALGWGALAEDALTPELAERRRLETTAGLDEWPRQAMVKDV